MNTTGCPAGYATDAAFYPALNTCDTSLVAFAVVSAVLFVLRASSLVQLVRLAMIRQRRRRVNNAAAAKAAAATATSTPRRSCRFGGSIMVNINIVMVVMFLLMFVLVGTNVATAANSAAWSLMSITFLGFAAWNAHSLRLMVRLGARIAPLRSRPMLSQAKAEALQRFDKVLHVLFMAQLIVVTVGSLLLILIGPFMHENLVPFGIAALVMKGLFVVFASVSLTHQFARVQRVLAEHIQVMKAGGGGFVPPAVGAGGGQVTVAPPEAQTQQHSGNIADLEVARNRLAVVAFLTALLYAPMVVIFFLQAAFVLPWTWYWTMTIPLFFETTGRVVVDCFVFAPRGGGRRRRRQNDEGGARSPSKRAGDGAGHVATDVESGAKHASMSSSSKLGGASSGPSRNADRPATATFSSSLVAVPPQS